MGRRTAPMRILLRECLVIAASTVALTSVLALPASAQTSPVQWTNFVNASANGSALQKSSGCSGCADAGATSVQALNHQDGFVEFTPGAGFRLYAGLGSDSTSNTDPALIDFAFSFWPDGGWDIRERNLYRTEGRFAAGDVFRIAVASGAVNYYQNGALVYTSLVQPAPILVLDTTLISGGATLISAFTTAAPPTPISIVTGALPDGSLGQPYAATLQATGGTSSFVWSVTGGALPVGVTMTSTGTLGGAPTSWGVAQFVARATDANLPSNYREQTFSILVPAPPNPVAIQTSTLPSTRLAQSYSTTLFATGGTGSLVWAIVSGALPPGVTLDASTGLIHGNASMSGRFTLTVKVTDSLNQFNANSRALTLSVLAGSPPSGYSALTDRVARAKGTLPALGPAGSTFLDPVFGSNITRITDGAVRPGLPNYSYRTPSSVHANAWSADERYFFAVSTDGTIIPFSFDRMNGRAQRLQPSATGDGGLTLQFFNEPTFSYIVPGIAYATFNGIGSNLRSVDQYDFETGEYSQLLNLDTLAPNLAGTYIGGLGVSAGPVERLIAFFGGTSQDRHFYLVVFDRNNPGNRHLLDTAASTLDGIPTSTILNFKIHAANIDRSGRFVIIYPTSADLQAPRSAPPVYVWDLETGAFTALPLVQAITGGHDAFGYGDRVNQDCCTTNIKDWDAAQWQYRSLYTPLSTVDLVVPVLRPEEVYLADHPSWHNAQPDRLVPFLEASYRYGANTTQWRPWDEEIIAIQTEGAGSGATVWRFAHHRSAVANDADPSWIYFWYTPRVNISPDGRWALFTSNWEKTLGTDPRAEVGGAYRQDVFLISLKAGAGAPCTFAIAPTSSNPTSAATTGSVTVTAGTGCSWTAVSNATSWLTVTVGASGSGNGSVGYSVAANTSTSARTGTITIGGQTFTVTQAGVAPCTFTIAPTSSNLTSSASTTGTVNVTAGTGCGWTAVSNDAWITISAGANGSGNGAVSYSVAANTRTASRTGTLTIGGQTFTINQAGVSCVSALSPTSTTAAASGASSVVTVSAAAGCGWTAISDDAWIAVTAGNTGTGNGTFSYTVAANTATTLRTGTVSVGGNTFSVKQFGATCSPTVSPSSANLPSTAGTGTITVSAVTRCNWTAKSNAAWIAITSGSPGSGNGTVNYSVTANTSTLARTGTVTIGTSVFAITQAAAPCTFTISPTGLALAAGGGIGSVSVTTGVGCSWSATSGAAWVTMSNGTGRSGSGTISFTAAANTTTTARSATLTIAGQSFVVTEPSAICTFAVTPSLVTIPRGGTTGTFTVTTQSGCAWTSSTSASWVTLTTASGTGSSTGAYTVTANPGTLSRSATISVAGVQISLFQSAGTSLTASPARPTKLTRSSRNNSKATNASRASIRVRRRL